MTQGLTSESDYLYVTATGAFSLDEAQLRFLEMLESVAELNVTKVLFDGRMLVGEPRNDGAVLLRRVCCTVGGELREPRPVPRPHGLPTFSRKPILHRRDSARRWR
jgi:hypothetical protein